MLAACLGCFCSTVPADTFSGWKWEEALVVLGIFTLLQGFSSTFLEPNLSRIVDRVQQGTLDFVLLKPISSQFWLSANTVSPWGIPDLIFGAVLLLYAANKLGVEIGNYFLTAIPLLFGTITLYSIWFMLGATSIWFVKIYNVTEVLQGVLEAGRFPMAAYPAAYRFFFTFVVPVAFLTTVPAEAMLGRGEIVSNRRGGNIGDRAFIFLPLLLAICTPLLHQRFQLVK